MRRSATLSYLAVIVVALGVNFRASAVGFLSDEFYLPLFLGGDGPEFGQILRDLSGPWLGAEGSPSYRPGQTLHYVIDSFFFRAHPAGYHLSNALLHALNACLVWALSSLLFPSGSWRCGFVAALLFAVHPATPEAVTWISGRVDCTTATPYLLALVLWARGRRRRRWGAMLVATVFGGASMLCKEVAITLPLSLLVVDGVVRRRFPGAFTFVAGIGLSVGYYFARVHALGGFLPAEGGAELTLARLFETLPDKARAIFSPVPWKDAHPVFDVILPTAFGVLPCALALLLRSSRVIVVPFLLWAMALLMPAYPVAIRDGYGGTRVLYLALVPVALLWGRALAGRRREPGLRGVLGVGAAALVLCLGALITDARNKVFVRATATVVGHQRWVADRFARDATPLFLANIEQQVAGVTAFRYDNAYLAFRKPFLPDDVPVYIGANMAEELQNDTAALQVALRAKLGAYVFDVEHGRRFEALSVPPQPERVLGFDALRPGHGLPVDETGVAIPASAAWTRVCWQAFKVLPTGYEALRLRVRGPELATPPVVSWFPEGAPLPEPTKTPAFFTCSALPLRTVDRTTAYVAPIGNRAGWTFGYRFRSKMSICVAVPPRDDTVVLELVRLVPRLPRLELTSIWLDEPVDLSRPLKIPLGAAEGAFRLILVTPMQVMEAFDVNPTGGITVGDKARRDLALTGRLAPGTRIYYAVDRLLVPNRRDTTLARSAVGSFLIR